MISATLKILKSYADFESQIQEADREQPHDQEPEQAAAPLSHGVVSVARGLNLAYTINLNLPATSDQAVFNAIFKSLKEHLLNNE